MKRRWTAWALGAIGAGLISVLVACGGGGGSPGMPGGVTTSLSGAQPGSMSSGTITAFGSVFVNGHEFSTAHATVVDDDADTSNPSAAGLEVGMVVDVKAASSSSDDQPEAAELHVHPLARGFVDASDSGAGTLQVMGQTVQLTSSTVFSDHRGCVSAMSSPCAAVTGQEDLVATTGSGAGATPGSYVTVHGYLFTDGSTPGSANIVATLVSVADAPAAPAAGVRFKAEGVVSAATGTNITIGGLAIDLASAQCFAHRAPVTCAGAFSVGQVVAAISSASPSLPATQFAPQVARLRAKVVADTAGTTVEVEGRVSSVTTTPAAFVVRGVAIDASTLPAGTSLPAAGDFVRVIGTIASDGTSIQASSVKVLHAARSATFILEGDAATVSAGSAAKTYVVTVLGQSITVNADTWLADRSMRDWDHPNPASNPFNIDTFQSYLAASVSQHLIVRSEADATGALTARSLIIVPASTEAGILGVIDASPAPVNSSQTGTPTTFSVHGLPVSADPNAVLRPHRLQTTTVAAGDEVLVLGTYAAGTLTVGAVPGRHNVVIDFGVPHGFEHHGF